MKRLQLVLACPRSNLAHELPTIAPDPEKVCAPVPKFWHGSDTPLVIWPEQGMAFGLVFHQSDARQCRGAECELPPYDSAETMARHIVAKFWGGYLVVLKDRISHSWALLSDPSGLVPIYRLKTPSHILLSTDPALLSQASGLSLRVSYRAVHSHLLRPELRQQSTCLEGVDEQTPGSLIYPAQPDMPARAIWKPADFLPKGPAPLFEDSAEELHHLSCSVLSRWGKTLGKLGVAASGGVDSSLICAALARTGDEFDCITVTTSDQSGDERAYARDVSTRFGVRCAERLYDPAIFNPVKSASSGLPRPSRRAFLNVLDTVLIDAMEEIGADAVLDGNGGDNLFCFLHSSAPVIDRLRAEGISVGIADTLLDMCRITGCSVPTMLRAMARRMSGQRTGGNWPGDTRLLTPGSTSDHFIPLTPWLDVARNRRSGKHDHLALIMHAQNHIHGLTTELSRFSPLFSQPLVEFCLSIPTWIWAQGGQNRALARAAFAEDLPGSILARTSKAGPDSFIRAAFSMNRQSIAEQLLGGLLSANKVIDRSAVEQALGVDEISDESTIDRLLDLLEAENWARSWLG